MRTLLTRCCLLALPSTLAVVVVGVMGALLIGTALLRRHNANTQGVTQLQGLPLSPA